MQKGSKQKIKFFQNKIIDYELLTTFTSWRKDSLLKFLYIYNCFSVRFLRCSAVFGTDVVVIKANVPLGWP